MRLYFAAPLFCQAELEFNSMLTEKIEALGLSVFLPQRDGDIVNQAPYINMKAEERAQAIFQMDKEELTSSDIFLYVLDGRVPDEGAAVALGLVFMYREESQKDIKIIGFHTDKRSAYLSEKLNPMISSALDMVIESEEALLEYIGGLEDLSVKNMWNAYLASVGETLEGTSKNYDAWSFGMGVQMANELAGLVVEGKKTATSSLHYLYELDGDPIPKVGEHSIILDGEGTAQCVIKTTAVDLIPYSQVSEAFAKKEGEGDLSLKYWREGHRKFFTEELKSYDKSFEEDMLVVCEEFEVAFPEK